MIDTSDAREALEKATEAIRVAQDAVDEVYELAISDFSTHQLIQIIEDRLQREAPQKRKLIDALWELRRAYAFENVVVEPQSRISDMLTEFGCELKVSDSGVAEVVPVEIPA